MEMIPVSSSVIDSIGYDTTTSNLMVVFRDGHVYEFHMVPLHVWEAFLNAPSKGAFFNEMLKEGPYGQRRTRRS